MARDFLDALARTVAATRQHGLRHPLAEAAAQQLVQRCAHQSLPAPLHIELRATAARCGGQTVFTDPNGVLLPALLALGVGSLVLVDGMQPDALRLLAQGLAAVDADRGAQDALIEALRQCGEGSPRLLPAELTPLSGPTAACAFDRLRPALPGEVARGAVAREQAMNLPARLARLLLADLDPGGDRGGADDATAALRGVVAAMTQRGDLAGCAMVLEQCRDPLRACGALAQAVGDLAQRLFAAKLEPCQMQQLAPDQLLALVGLAVQLGSCAVEQLLQQATHAGVHLPDWLVEAIRPPAI